MNKITYIILALNLVLAVSCGDFLTENSQNSAYVETVKDLDELLIGDVYVPITSTSFPPERPNLMGFFPSNGSVATRYFPWIHIMDDDAQEYMIKTPLDKMYTAYFLSNAFYWQPNPFMDPKFIELNDAEWSNSYKRIAVINSILYQLDLMKDQEEDQELVKRVEGEACFMRGFLYFWIQNLYGAPYCKATEKTDLGVTLKISEVIEDKYYSRSTNEVIYKQIVKDLERSVECLKGVNKNGIRRANYNAANLLLSRVYLYMEEYEKAIECADRVIESKLELIDLNTHPIDMSITQENSSEAIFTQGLNSLGSLFSAENTNVTQKMKGDSYSVSVDLLSCFDESQNDLRMTHYLVDRGGESKGTYRPFKWKKSTDPFVSDHWYLRLPEAYLNKAEAEAALGRSSAIETIQTLRAKRFKPSDLQQINLTGAELVQFIRDERRRELCFEGHRWFDLRRYAVNSLYPYSKEITHISYGYDGSSKVNYAQGKYVLKSYHEDKAAWTLPIPRSVVEFNKGNIMNAVRPTRKIIIL